MDFKKWFMDSDEDAFFLSLVNAAKNKQWIPLTRREGREFWQNDGDLVERWEITSPAELHKVHLTIPVEHMVGLKNLQEPIVELYNSFDIWLKNNYHMNVVDFIDYDNGVVVLIKPIKYSM